MSLTIFEWVDYWSLWGIFAVAVSLRFREKKILVRELNNMLTEKYGIHDMLFYVKLERGVNGMISWLFYLTIVSSLVVTLIIGLESGIITF